MGRAHNDDKGWKRGLGAYTDADCGLMSQGKDTGNQPIRDISEKCGINEKTDWVDVNPDVGKFWKPGPVSSGGKWHKFNNGPPQPPATTKPVGAYSPSGKYGKKGGPGQRSGA